MQARLYWACSWCRIVDSQAYTDTNKHKNQKSVKMQEVDVMNF
jgi:hypothetical protein